MESSKQLKRLKILGALRRRRSHLVKFTTFGGGGYTKVAAIKNVAVVCWAKLK